MASGGDYALAVYGKHASWAAVASGKRVLDGECCGCSLSSSQCVLTPMADLPALLLASLQPDSRKQAEQSLQALSLQPGFLPHLLTLVLQSSQDRAVRLAGSVYLKNLVKSRWDDVRRAALNLDLA